MCCFSPSHSSPIHSSITDNTLSESGEGTDAFVFPLLEYVAAQQKGITALRMSMWEGACSQTRVSISLESSLHRNATFEGQN